MLYILIAKTKMMPSIKSNINFIISFEADHLLCANLI